MFRINREVSVDVRFSISDQHERLIVTAFGRNYTDEDWKNLSNADAQRVREEMISKVEKQLAPYQSFDKVAEEATKVSELRHSDVTGNCFLTITVAPEIVDENSGEITADTDLVDEIHEELRAKMVKVNQLPPLVNEAVEKDTAQIAD